MSGGIDWFRWHHGTVTDQKFVVIARRADCTVAEAIAVWACLLEAASMAENRGDAGSPDFEAMDAALGLWDGKTERIYTALKARTLVDEQTGRIAAWERRQPKREREDSSAERMRAHRASKSQQEPSDDDANHVTPCDASHNQEKPRGEKRREEKKSEEKEKPRKRVPAPERPADVSEQVWSDWLQLRKGKNAAVTATVVAEAIAEAAKAGVSVERFLSVWCARGSQGLQADWLKPHERAGPLASPKSFRERDADHASARYAEMTGGLIGAKKQNPVTFENEHATTLALD